MRCGCDDAGKGGGGAQGQTGDEGEFVRVVAPAGLHGVFLGEGEGLGGGGGLEGLGWGSTNGVLHPLVVGGDVVCAVGDEEDFGGGDGWWKTEVIEGSILRDS